MERNAKQRRSRLCTSLLPTRAAGHAAGHAAVAAGSDAAFIWPAALLCHPTPFPAFLPATLQLSARLAGLALTQSLQLAGLLQWMVRQSAEVENNMTSGAGVGGG